MTRREFLAAASVVTVGALGAETLLTSCEAPPNFRVLFMMPIQSIQNTTGAIPLIAGKRTIVRVFPASTGQSDVANISGQLSVFAGDSATGTPSGQGVLLNGPISSHAATAVDPDQVDHALDFEIPLSLLTGGDLTVQCQLSTTGGPPFPVSATRTLRFQTIANQEKIHPVLIQDISYSAAAPAMSDFQAALSGVIKRLPVPETHFIVHDPLPWVTNRAMTSSDDFYWLCVDIASNFQFDPSRWQSGFPVGLIFAPSSFPTSTITTGMYYSGFTGSVVGFAAGPSINRDAAEGTLAHEFSHNYGLGHAGGCLSPANVDSTLPMSTDMTGMDVPLHIILPRGTSELMSYCNYPRWPSSTTYNRVLAKVS